MDSTGRASQARRGEKIFYNEGDETLEQVP